MEGFFALRVWGAYIWRGLYMEGLIHGGAYFQNFTVSSSSIAARTHLYTWVKRDNVE